MRLYASFLFLHVLAVTFWVGGMAVLHMSVRPSMVALLLPEHRLPLMAATLKRFFGVVTVAVWVVLISGVLMIARVGREVTIEIGGNPLLVGMEEAHPSVHAMFFVGLVMMAIYAHVRFAPFKRLQRAVEGNNWAEAATHLEQIRWMVSVNLVLGVLTIAVATLGRAIL